jgi:hypothetical protein
MERNKKIKASEEVREALFEIQVDAFLAGLADAPSADKFGLSPIRAHEIFDQSMTNQIVEIDVLLAD